MKKNCIKFRLIVVWFRRTREMEDFDDVTLAWEDEEEKGKKKKCLETASKGESQWF